jgi:DNA-binding NarL/FixJ family response regulator
MIRAIVIADSGSTLGGLTRSLDQLQDLEIVRYASGRTHVTMLMRVFSPDLVIVDEMRRPATALARIAEVRQALPAATVVVQSAAPEADWLAEALQAGAAAVFPATIDAGTLGLVLHEALAETPSRVPAAAAQPLAA